MTAFRAAALAALLLVADHAAACTFCDGGFRGRQTLRLHHAGAKVVVAGQLKNPRPNATGGGTTDFHVTAGGRTWPVRLYRHRPSSSEGGTGGGMVVSPLAGTLAKVNVVAGQQVAEGEVLAVVEADPVVKGQTAASSYKPARLENGLRVLVPPHIESGTRIVVSTSDGRYLERSRD